MWAAWWEPSATRAARRCAGASITVTNTATNIETSATSNGSGDYEIPSLHVGIYTISAKATNYAEAVAQNISIAVGSRQRIDLELKVGQTQTSVEVSDVALQLETDSSQRGQTITQYQTEALPLVTPQLLGPVGPGHRLAASPDRRYDQLDQQPGAPGRL